MTEILQIYEELEFKEPTLRRDEVNLEELNETLNETEGELRPYYSSDLKDLVRDVLIGTHMDKIKDKYAVNFDVVEGIERKNWVWEDRIANYMTIVNSYLTGVDVYSTEDNSDKTLDQRLDDQIDLVSDVYSTFSELKDETLNKRFKRIKNKERGARVSQAFDMVQSQLDEKVKEYTILLTGGRSSENEVTSNCKAEDYDDITEIVNTEAFIDEDDSGALDINLLEDLNPDAEIVNLDGSKVEEIYDLANGPVSFGPEPVEAETNNLTDDLVYVGKEPKRDLAREWRNNIIAAAKDEVAAKVLDWYENMIQSSNPSKYLRDQLSNSGFLSMTELVGADSEIHKEYAECLALMLWDYQLDAEFTGSNDRERKVKGLLEVVDGFSEKWGFDKVFDANYNSNRSTALRTAVEREEKRAKIVVDNFFREMTKEAKPSKYLERKLGDLNFIPGAESRVNKIYAKLLCEKVDSNVWKTVLGSKTEKTGWFRKSNAYDTVSKVIENYADKWDANSEDKEAEVVELPVDKSSGVSLGRVAAAVLAAGCTVAFPAQAGDGSDKPIEPTGPSSFHTDNTYNYNSRGIIDDHCSRWPDFCSKQTSLNSFENEMPVPLGSTSSLPELAESDIQEVFLENKGNFLSIVHVNPVDCEAFSCGGIDLNLDNEGLTIANGFGADGTDILLLLDSEKEDTETSLLTPDSEVFESEQFIGLDLKTQFMMQRAYSNDGFVLGEIFASGNGKDMEIVEISSVDRFSIRHYDGRS